MSVEWPIYETHEISTSYKCQKWDLHNFWIYAMCSRAKTLEKNLKLELS